MPCMDQARLAVSAAALLAVAHGAIAGQAAGTGRESPASGRIEPAAPMQASRAAHTATALRDGHVLVAGGFAGSGTAAGAELYGPGPGRFSPLPPMVTARYSHTATRLPDGRVLIAGGHGSGGRTLAAAEIFDPATRRFVATGSLRAARSGHVAVLLDTGKVLVAGGLGPGWTFLSSAELYDPATGRFTAAAGMGVPRESHVAVRLRDGRVLVVGGHNGQRRNLTLLASAEIYDPAANAFTRVADMRIRRHKHDAVLLPDGRVLVTGGSDERDSAGVYRSTEFFDPQTARFKQGPSMHLGRYKHAGTSLLLPGGYVLLAGGAAQAERFDIRQGVFSKVPGASRMTGQFSAVAPLGGGDALVTGGYGSAIEPQASAWVYRR